MNRPETVLLCSFMAFYIPAFGLYHLMIHRVNQDLPQDDKIPHSLSLVGWNRLANEYRRFYPRSFLYQFTATCAVTCLLIALGFGGLRIWEYVSGR